MIWKAIEKLEFTRADKVNGIDLKLYLTWPIGRIENCSWTQSCCRSNWNRKHFKQFERSLKKVVYVKRSQSPGNYKSKTETWKWLDTTTEADFQSKFDSEFVIPWKWCQLYSKADKIWNNSEIIEFKLPLQKQWNVKKFQHKYKSLMAWNDSFQEKKMTCLTLSKD